MHNKSPHPTYRAIVFDWGGVIQYESTQNNLDIAADILGIPIAQVKEVYFAHNHLANVEDMPWDEMFSKVLTALGATEEIEQRIFLRIRDNNKTKSLNTELLSVFGVLREQGYIVAVFSNNTSQRRKVMEEQGIMKKVDDVIISAEIGFQKPQKEAFDVLFSRLDVAPREVIFVDDTPKSLENADEIGYTPILFKNNELLKEDLQKLGISI